MELGRGGNSSVSVNSSREEVFHLKKYEQNNKDNDLVWHYYYKLLKLNDYRNSFMVVRKCAIFVHTFPSPPIVVNHKIITATT